MKKSLKLENTYFFDSVPKNEIINILNDIDVTIVPLKKLDIFKGAIPSKIFENLAMKNALILGVDGEAKKLFIDYGNAGLYFEPENEHDLAKQVIKILENNHLIHEFGENGRIYVAQNFNREVIAQNFKNKLEALGG